MGRSETESLRFPIVEFWSGKTVHLESKVGAESEKGILVEMLCVLCKLVLKKQLDKRDFCLFSLPLYGVRNWKGSEESGRDGRRRCKCPYYI